MSAAAVASLFWVRTLACSSCCDAACLRLFSATEAEHSTHDSGRQVFGCVLIRTISGAGTYGTPDAHTFTLVKVKFGNETQRLPYVQQLHPHRLLTPGNGCCPACWSAFGWFDILRGLVSGRCLVSTRPEARGFGGGGADLLCRGVSPARHKAGTPTRLAS